MKYKFYYKDGSVLGHYDENKTLHREDGPAFIGYTENGKVRYEKYYLEGLGYLEEEYYKILEEAKNMDEVARLTDPRKWVRELK